MGKNRRILGIFAVVMMSAAVSQADVPVFAEKTKTVRVSEQELQTLQTRAYREFRKDCCYFGAFAINQTSDVAFFVRGFNSVALAIEAAEEGCREVSKLEDVSPDTCRLYAYSLPSDIAPTDRRAAGLGLPARDMFTNAYQSRQTKTGYGAFAVGPARGHGASWNWSSPDEARKAALAHCQAHVASIIADLGPAAVDWAKESKTDSCKIIHETAPQS
jgi:hypothetical protein